MSMKLLFPHANWWPRARAEGLVEGQAPQGVGDDEPSTWLIALALVGALLCTLPLAAFLVIQIGEHFWFRNPAAMVISLCFLAGSGYMLRQSRHIFALCVALVFWTASSGMFFVQLGEKLDRAELGMTVMGLLVAVLQVLGAWVSPALWIKRIMGLGFAGGVLMAWVGLVSDLPVFWALQLHTVGLAAVWLWWVWSERRWLQQSQRASRLAGWTAFVEAMTIGALAMLLTDGMRYMFWMHSGNGPDISEAMMRVIVISARAWPVLLTVVSTALLVQRWRKVGALSESTSALVLWVGLLLAVGAWFSPGLGVVAVIAAGALIGARWRMAVLCAVGALWLLGHFYYELNWSLAAKGGGLALVGALLLVSLYVQRVLALRGKGVQPESAAGESMQHGAVWSRARVAWLVAGAVLVFGLINWDVRGKEHVIAQGQPVLIPLVPVDPRSLMQGDYMALRFDIPGEVLKVLENSLQPRALVIASLDAQGHAQVKRLAGPEEKAGAGEILLPLKQLKGRWVVVTDAYFFAEGQGRAFEHARYGDFRVLPDGRALLVGLADDNGVPIAQPKSGTFADTSGAASDGPDTVPDTIEAPEAEESARAVEVVPAPPQPTAPAPVR